MSIARRILIAVLGGLLPLVAGLAAAAAEVRSTVREEVLSGLGRVAEVEGSAIQQSLTTLEQRIAQLLDEDSPLVSAIAAGGPSARSGMIPMLRQLLHHALEDYPLLQAVSLYHLSGVPITSAWKPGQAEPWPVSPADVTAALGGPTVGEAYRPPGGVARFQLLIPLKAGGVAVAVLVVDCDLQQVVAALEDKSSLGRSVEAQLVQRTADGGAMFISPLRFEAGADFEKVVPASDVQAPPIMALQGDGVQEGMRDYRNVEVVAAFRQIDDTPWALVIKVDHSEAFASYARLSRSLGLVGAVIGLFLVVGLSLTARSIVQRLRGVTETAEAISRGDLSRRIGSHGEDEFGRLARAFDDMADHLSADIERRRQVEAELQDRARHDDLTGLPGRMAAYEDLSAALSDPDQPITGLLFCDLDSFKTVNDELGHSAGDALLQQVAQRLRHAVGPGEVVARFGGDEFVVVCRRLRDRDAIAAVAERLRRALSAPFGLAGRSIVVTASIGSVVVEPGAPTTAEALLRDADAAMYRAKELGRNRHVASDDEIRLRASVALSAVINLRRALVDGSLELHYQPVFDLRRNTVYGVEALLRRPGLAGLPVDPYSLVALAAASGLSVELDEWVFSTACRQLRSWLEAGCSGLCLSVNLSAASLDDPSLVPFLLGTANASGLSPQRLCLELTEVAVHRDGGAADKLQQLRAAGFRVAIDDFGMGYSNLTRLRELPVDVLKVDRSFLQQLEFDPAARQICQAITQLGQALGLAVVAEGVEHRGQADVLAELGCQLAQGHLFAPALDADELLAFVSGRRNGQTGQLVVTG